MSITLANLRTRTSYWLDESGATGGYSGGVSSAETLQWINWSYAEVLRMTPVYSENINVIPKTINLVSGTEQYDLAANFQAMKKVEGNWDKTDPAVRYQIDPIQYDERIDYYSGNTMVGSNSLYKYYMIFTNNADTPLTYSQKIGFVPIPTATLTAAIKYWYWPRSLVLADETDAILPLLEEYSELIAVKAARRIKMKSGLDISVLIAQEKELEAQLRNNLINIQRSGPESTDYRPDLWEQLYEED